jgi:hypothetical protein
MRTVAISAEAIIALCFGIGSLFSYILKLILTLRKGSKGWSRMANSKIYILIHSIAVDVEASISNGINSSRDKVCSGKVSSCSSMESCDNEISFIFSGTVVLSYPEAVRLPARKLSV